MLKDEFGRELIEIVQIDQDFCNNTFGVAPCTAVLQGVGKQCFNTYATCQDQANYDKGVKTLTFAKNQTAIVDEYFIPSLVSYSTQATQVNIGARRTSAFDIGKFSSLTVQFQDLIHSDNVVDPYRAERTYNPLEQGTFWAKWLARNPYFEGREIRVYEGYVGQTIAEMDYKKFLIDKISNPNSKGGVTINAVDPFRKLDAAKAQFPKQTQAELATDISSGDTLLITSGRVIDGYEFGGNYLSIGTEIISYTTETNLGGGSYRYSGLVRGIFGSTSEEHKTGDAVQHTVYYDPDSPTSNLFDTIYGLFLEAGFDGSDLDGQSWLEEIDTWLSTYSRLNRVLWKPTPINQLVGELQASCGFFMWFDEIEKLVKLKAIRPETEELPTLNEDNNLIQNQTSSKLETNERISEVWIDYSVTDYTGDLDKRESYSATKVRIDPTAASPNEYGERIVYNTQAKWLFTLAQIDQLGFRTLSRYRDNTRFISFQLDAKDDLKVGQAFTLMYSGFTNEFGEPLDLAWQVISRKTKADRVMIQAQEFYFLGNYCFIMPDDANDYDNATDEEKRTGGYISPTSDGEEYLIV